MALYVFFIPHPMNQCMVELSFTAIKPVSPFRYVSTSFTTLETKGYIPPQSKVFRSL